MNNNKPHWDSEILHPLYSEILLHMAKAYGTTPEQVCNQEQIEKLQHRQNPRWFAALLLKLLQKNPAMAGIGFEYGALLDLASAGVIGQVITTAPTLGRAFELICRYYPLTGLLLNIDHYRIEEALIIRFDMDYDDVPPLVFIHTFEAILSSWAVCTRRLCNRELPVRKLCLSYPEPSYSESYRVYFPCDIQFDCLETTIAIDLEAYKYPTQTANPVVHTRAATQCEEALAKRSEILTVTEQLRKQLKQLDGLAGVSLEALAGRMNMSCRTLARRLRQENASFQGLLDEQRSQRACSLRYLIELGLD